MKKYCEICNEESEAMKCILVCSNCHKEIHAKIGYIFK